MAVNRIIVEAPLYDEFLSRFTAAVSGVPFGDLLPHRPWWALWSTTTNLRG